MCKKRKRKCKEKKSSKTFSNVLHLFCKTKPKLVSKENVSMNKIINASASGILKVTITRGHSHRSVHSDGSLEVLYTFPSH